MPLLSLSAPAEPDDTAVQAMLKARLPTEEKRLGLVLRSLDVTGTFLECRRVTLTIGTTGAATAPSDVTGYAADILALVQDLNTQENAGIAVLRFDAYDPSGTPLLQERHDLDLGRNASAYASFDYFPAWASRPATTATGLAAAPAQELPAAERERLDNSTAAGVVNTYFSSGDYDVEYYLSAPYQREEIGAGVREHEREGGVDHLVVDGPFPAIPLGTYSTSEWPEQVQFTVSYISRWTSSIGEPPGKRFWFVYVGRQSQDRPWKVLSIGTGP